MKIKLTKETLIECLTNATNRIIEEETNIKKLYNEAKKNSKKGNINESKNSNCVDFKYTND